MSVNGSNNSSTSQNNTYLYSSIPAKWIDRLLLYAPEFGWAKSPKQSGARALSLLISITVFPFLLIVDLCRFSAKSINSRIWSRLANDDAEKKNYANTAEKSHEVALKCLRGVAAFPAGIVWRDVVSNHFIPEKNFDGRIHPKGNFYTSEADVRHPETIQEVAEIVKNAGNQRISIAGAGYAQGKHTLPPNEQDIHINMSLIDHIKIDPETKIATVGAGITWGQIQNEADQHQLAVQVMQASNVFSVGGSLSANCHGWDHIQGSLINTIVSLTIVNVEGEIVRVKRGDPLFNHVISGYGLFGVVVESEIRLTENEKLYDTAKKVEIDDYVTYFREKVETNPHIKMHLYRLSLEPGRLLREGWAQNYKASEPKDRSEHLDVEPPNGNLVDRILMQVARNSPLARKLWWNREAATLGNRRIKEDFRNNIMRPKINAAFATNSVAKSEWLQEYFVPEEHLAEFIHFLGTVLDENEVALLNASVRYVKHDPESALGYAHDGDRFAVVLFFTQSLNKHEVEKTRKWVQKVVAKLAEFKGTFYLPYAHLATTEQFRKCYPHWKEVKEFKDKYDPNGRFNNGLYQDYFVEGVKA